MEGVQPDDNDKVIAKALRLLRDSGFTAAAAKLQKEFDSSADDGATVPAANAQTNTVSENEDVTRCEADRGRHMASFSPGLHAAWC